MSTAVAAFAPAVERHISPQHFPTLAAAAAPPTISDREPALKRMRGNASPSSLADHHSNANANTNTPLDRAHSSDKPSPTSGPGAALPVIKVKKEPGSPPSMSSRPRPKRLDLSSSIPDSRAPPTTGQASRPSAPLTSRESAGLAIQDVGLACLSPGFQTNDPGMREQLQRSLDVRDQQRQIIEARQKGAKPGSAHETDAAQRTQDSTLFGVQTRTPTTSRRKGPPPGLSIAAPSASQFANDRVIQSAPINQTFTGLRPGDQAYSRHVQHGPSALSQTSHIHHVPAMQTNNRLPPIADVFANDRLEVQRGLPSAAHSPSHPGAAAAPSAPSPGFPSQQQQPPSRPSAGSHGREFRSAEEAVAGLSGGRDDLMPKVVHYGGVQPPTPPSPMPPGASVNHHSHHNPHIPQYQQQHATVVGGALHSGPPSGYSDMSSSSAAGANAGAAGPGGAAAAAAAAPQRHDVLARTSSMNGRRRGREEFERDNGSPPRLAGPGSSFQQRAEAAKRASFAVRAGGGVEDVREDWRSGMSGAEKKEEFLRLCERAWDLFHS